MSDARRIFAQTLAAHQDAVAQLGDEQLTAVADLADRIAQAWRQGGKLLVCGNGGSAADSQHLAAELAGRYRRERPGLAALALTTDTSALTAIGNDFGFDQIFARQVEALATPHDVLLVISTSGNSPNCVVAVDRARELGVRCHGLLGGDGGRLLGQLDGAVVVPSGDTPRIQEMHLIMIHTLCELLEAPDTGEAP